MRYEREEYVRQQMEVIDALDSAYLAWCRLVGLPDDKSAEELIWNEKATPDQRKFLADFLSIYQRV
jgi:hypothetical protein